MATQHRQLDLQSTICYNDDRHAMQCMRCQPAHACGSLNPNDEMAYPVLTRWLTQFHHLSLMMSAPIPAGPHHYQLAVLLRRLQKRDTNHSVDHARAPCLFGCPISAQTAGSISGGGDDRHRVCQPVLLLTAVLSGGGLLPLVVAPFLPSLPAIAAMPKYAL